MNIRPRLLLAALLALSTLPVSAQAPAACAALQTEVETLKARIRELEAGAATGKAAAATAAVAPAAVAPTPAVPAAAPAAAPQSGLAPKPAKRIVVVEEEPYSRSGCRPSLFQPLPHAVWMDADPWLDLEKGMTPVEVEKLLGPEHYDVVGSTRLLWLYGKCEAASKAQVLFSDGKLLDWRAPGN